MADITSYRSQGELILDLGWALNPNDWCPYKMMRGTETQRRNLGEDSGCDWSDAATSRGKPRAAGAAGSQEKARRGSSLKLSETAGPPPL